MENLDDGNNSNKGAGVAILGDKVYFQMKFSGHKEELILINKNSPS
jgi:hypothetical protein